ncbi:MAG: hypothetical protein IJC71_03230 [Clostridia bacterium]|nr:hypothetical protein [Clostridia bacterium]
MKKTALLLLPLLLTACTRTPYVYEDVPKTDSIREMGAYTWEASAVSHSETSLLRSGQRGFFFLDDDRLSAYNPATGQTTYVCADPLCTHGLSSDCVFRYCIFSGVPKQSGERLFWWDVVKNLSEADRIHERKYRICSSDLTGQAGKVLYQNSGNMILGMDTDGEKIVFLEQIGEGQCILHAMDMDGRNRCAQPCGEEEEKIVTSFALLGERIFYIENGTLHSCASDFSDVRQIAQTADVMLYADREAGLLYWNAGGILYACDPGTEKVTVLYEPPAGMTVRWITASNGAVWFRQYGEDIVFGGAKETTYEKYTGEIAVRGQNILYRLDLASGELREYALPEGLFFINYTVEGDYVYGIRLRADERDGSIRSGAHFCWNTAEGTLLDFSEGEG